MKAERAIELRGLRREFGERAALSGIDLELEAGRTLAVLGPNGSGKTTLLRILAGLLRPSGGEAAVLGSPCRPRPGACAAASATSATAPRFTAT